jgi:hypothetical protein
MSKRMTFAVGDQTWKTPHDGNLKDGTLVKWGDVDECHRHLQQRIDKLERKLELANKCVDFYGDRGNWNWDYFNPPCNDLGDEMQEGGEFARETKQKIKEIDG